MEARWSRSSKSFVLALYFIFCAWLVYAARPLLVPLFLSLLIAYLLSPAVRLLAGRTRLKRTRAVVLTYAVFLIVLIAIPSSFTSLAVRQVNRMASDVNSILAAVETFIEQPIRVGGLTLDPPRDTILALDQEIRSLVSQGSSAAIATISSLGTNLVWLLIMLVTTFYLLRDGPQLRAWFIAQFSGDYRADVDRLLGEIDVVWGTYLRGQVILGALIGVLTGISMAIVGLRGALVIGLIAGVLDLIPSLGPLVGGAISVVVALALGSSNLAISNFWFAALVGGIFFVIQQFENVYLAPKILGERLKMHPALVVIGVLGALALSGILGAFVVIPMLASLFILHRYLRARLADRNPWSAEDPFSSDEEEKIVSKVGDIPD